MQNKKFLYNMLALLLAAGIGLFSAWPFFQSPGLPADNDAELHIYRIAEMGYSLKAGSLYPRWAPDFYHGYGYPIFNYYAPLTYHMGNWLTLLRPEQAEMGAKMLFVLSLVASAVGAYALGALYGGRGGGLLGALVFSFAPYIQLINPHIRGALAETLALAALPWTMWAWERLWRQTRYRHTTVVVAALATGVTFLGHNLTGLTMVVMVAALSLWRLAISLLSPPPSSVGGYVGPNEGPVSIGRAVSKHKRPAGSRLAWSRALAALVAAASFVLLTAFFWFPFLAERDAIQLDVAGEGHYDFRNHFVTLRELLTPVPPMDHRATTTVAPMAAGVYGLGCALLGWLAATREQKRDLGVYGILALLLFWLVTRSSRFLWEIVPGLVFYQFPWRFLGPLAVVVVPLVAVLARAPACIRLTIAGSITRLIANAVPPVAGAVILLGAMPGLYPQPWTSGFEAITPRSIVQAELRGRWRGTTSTNDFVPTTVDMIPGPEEAVLRSYASPPVDRVNRYTLPEGTVVQLLPDVPWVHRFAITTERSFLLRLYLFDFPGWRAYLDGEPVEIELARPEGFITVDVSQGRHDVVVRFESTPARTWGWVLSSLGALGLLVPLAWTSAWRRSPDPSPIAAGTASRAGLIGVGGVVIVVALLKGALFDPMGWFRYQSPVGEARAAQHPQNVLLGPPESGAEIGLLGYDFSQRRLRPGDSLEVTLYWQARKPLTQTYQSFVHLVYPEGEIWAQSDHLNPAGFPTNLWPTDQYVRDKHQLTLPQHAPPGPYLVSVGLYTMADDKRLPVQAAECGQRPDHVILCQPITVRR